MNTPPQKRRTLSLRDGLAEIRRSMDGAQPAERAAVQAPDGKAGSPKPGGGPDAPAAKPARKHRPAAKPARAKAGETKPADSEKQKPVYIAWGVFAKRYPAFRARLPLKLGVLEELVAAHPEYSRTLIRRVLGRHMNHRRYHQHVAAGGPRYALDGSVSAGPGITAGHIENAKAALERQKSAGKARAQRPDT